MDYQSFGRHRRPKVANIKQALQLMLLLAVCSWLLYQINHSRGKSCGHIKFLEEYGVVLLGRRGTPSWLNQITLPNSGNEHSVAEAEDTTKDSSQEDSRKIHVKPRSESEYPNMPIRIDDSLSDDKEAEAEAQVREPLHDVQSREKDKLDGFYSFQDENGVPPEGNISSFTFGKETRAGELDW